MKLTKLNDLLDASGGAGAVIKGCWELGPCDELRYRAEGKEEAIKLKGSLVAAEPDALVFSVTERQSDQEIVTSLARLSGRWMLNPKNQIAFEVDKESGKNNVLTFRGGWKVNRSHEIVYTVQRTGLKTKTSETHELIFKGYWDLGAKNRLTYYVGGDSENALRFRGAFQTRSILAKKGEIRYQIGAEVNGKKRIQIIILFGRWIVSRDFSLLFEVEYEGGRKKAIVFGGERALSKDAAVNVNLTSREGEPLGAELILTKDIFGKDGQAFVRLQRSVEESRAEAGVRFRW